MGLLEGKIALVTGAGRGIGLAVASRFAQEGARVVVNDMGCGPDGLGHDEAVAEAAVEQMLAQGGKAVACSQDVGSAQGAQAAVQTAIDAFGGLDIVVCAAGIVRDKTLLKMDEESFEAVMNTVVGGTFWTVQAAAKQMVQQGQGGRIVTMTGLAGYHGQFGQTNLAAACGAVHGLTRSAAIELQKHKITVNAVAPLAKTRLTEASPQLQGFDNLTPEHVAPVALLLASDLCAERTGNVLAVAGARVHALRFVESAGKFKDEQAGIFTPQELDEVWSAIIKV